MTGRIKAWVVGAGGLVGSAIVRSGDLETFSAAPVPWGTPGAAPILHAELDRFVEWVADDQWGLVWAAGAGVMHTSQSTLDDELAVFRSFCLRASDVLRREGGGFYLVSSAGGVYAGSLDPPFRADTATQPLNAYGRTKLEQEDLALELLAPHLPVTIGRLANVYGPGQDLTKQQGLITQLCLCALLNRPATIFAPLSTLRDYIYVDDAAHLVTADVFRMASASAAAGTAGATRRVVCSGRSTSIAEVVTMVGNVTGRRIPLIHTLGDGPFILDLRLTASEEGVGRGAPPTSLEVGIALVQQDLLRRLGDGALALV
ncbi:NAD-dependent epimerase/dehydratase family protein [Aeromicrobium sp.]|uniref:NAD-dependent epimerase/dehydratase family protein n=1 Tax=Aeromicrobium sp. TaxID=1871063 RepID=UPI0019BF4F86|nr:NAD-dependent epimerase/dehydratase family protein [Aeromicrobium sp.]MBC7630841.1 NAD-dependent epimerase/dehydratase family protein [Aeromicrobium sp.]